MSAIKNWTIFGLGAQGAIFLEVQGSQACQKKNVNQMMATIETMKARASKADFGPPLGTKNP